MIVPIVLASILLTVLFVLLTPVRLRVTASNSDISAVFSFLGIFKKRLYPLPSRKKRKKTKKNSKAEPKESESKPDNAKPSAIKRLRELRSLLASLLIRMPKTFSLHVRRLRISVASDDPAKTALLYGSVTSALAFVLEWIDRRLLTVRPIRGGAVSVRADFERESTQFEADLILRTSPLRLLSLGIKVLLPYLFRRLKKHKKSSAQRKELSNVRSEKQAQ